MNKKTKIIITIFSLSVVIFLFMLIYADKLVDNNTPNDPIGSTNDLHNDPINIDNSNIGTNISNNLTSSAICTDSAIVKEEDCKGITTGQTYKGKLVADDSINILFVGEDVQYKLYDTIGILSIDNKSKQAKIIMFPRDIYIDYNKKIQDGIKKVGFYEYKGIFKINNSHNVGNYITYKEGECRFGERNYKVNFFTDMIYEKFNVYIDDYIVLSTEGFADLVDLFGGVDVDVPYNMYYEDPYQDLSIHIEEGRQHLDGKAAEGFVRFRQGYDENGELTVTIGDYGRKQNQIEFLKEFYSQNMKLSNLEKIPELIDTINKCIDGTSVTGTKVLKYLDLARKVVMGKYEITNFTLSGEEIEINGSMYIDVVGK